jgi:hypothetical protein
MGYLIPLGALLRSDRWGDLTYVTPERLGGLHWAPDPRPQLSIFPRDLNIDPFAYLHAYVRYGGATIQLGLPFTTEETP